MMKPGMCLMFLTFLTAVMMKTVSAQSDCTNVLFGMVPCLDYITGNSSSPSQQCCIKLADVVRSSPKCLCEVLNGGGPQIGINFNQTQALALPKACNVKTPPVSRCNDGDSDNPPESSDNSEQGNGSKIVAGARSTTSDGSSIKFSFPLLSILFVASYISVYSKYHFLSERH